MADIGAVMDKVSHGIYILGVSAGEKKNLMTAAWLMQVSGHPEELVVAVSSNHYTAELIEEAKTFTVSVLSEGQEAAAKACGFVSGRRTDKTQLVPVQYVNGIPYVEGGAAVMECRLKETVKVGSHTLFIAGVTGGEAVDKKPLLYHKKDYFG